MPSPPCAGWSLPARVGVLLLAVLRAARPAAAAERRVRVEGRQLFVEGSPFLVKGVCYSPVPINESVYFAP